MGVQSLSTDGTLTTSVGTEGFGRGSTDLRFKTESSGNGICDLDRLFSTNKSDNTM